jgi:hypothetical protein
MAVAFATVFLCRLFCVVTVYNAESCKSEKPRNNFPKLKTGEHCRSILSGVEVGEALTTASGRSFVRAEVKL